MLTRPITRGITRPITRPLVRQSSVFDPLTLFSEGQQGAWYDPSDLTTLFQDTAGTTPVTVDGDPVGLMLDKRLGLRTGDTEFVVNGDFSGGNTGWTLNPGWSISNGRAVADNVTFVAHRLSTVDEVFISEGTFLLQFDLNVTEGGVKAVLTDGGYTGYFSSSGRCTAVINRAGANNARLDFMRDEKLGIFTGTIDNVSVRELPGNHASQSTTAAKPTKFALGLSSDGVDDLMDMPVGILDAQEFTCVFSVRPLRQSTSDTLFDLTGDAAGGGRFYPNDPVGEWMRWRWSESNYNEVVGDNQIEQWFVGAITVTGRRTYFYRNGALQSSVGTPNSGVNYIRTVLFGAASSRANFSGNLGGCIFRTPALTDNEVLLSSRYLAIKAGVDLP